MTITMLVLIAGIGGIFLALFLSLTAIGVFTNETRGLSRSLAVMNAFTTAPEAMQKELDRSFSDRVTAPLLNRFVSIGRKLTPDDYADRIRQRLDVAGNPSGWTVDRVTSLKFVGFAVVLAAAMVVCLLMKMTLLPTLGIGVSAALLGYMAPNIYLHQRGVERTHAMKNALPDTLDLLTISVEAGLAFDSAVQQVSRNTEGPLSDEFARVLQEMQIGLGRSKALRALGDRSALPELRSFVSAMVQADAFGIPIGKVLRIQASEIRVKRRQEAEEKAQKVAVKLMIPLILCILPCLFIAVLGPAGIGMMNTFSGM